MNPRVTKVIPKPDYKLHLEFSNGERGVFDCTPFVGKGVFKEFEDVGYFLQAKECDGTVAWPHEQDICPDTLYLDSVKH